MLYLKGIDISQITFTWEIVYGGCGTVKSPDSGEIVITPDKGRTFRYFHNQEELIAVLGFMSEGRTEANSLLKFWGVEIPTRKSNNYSGYDKLTVTIEGTYYNWVKKVTEKEVVIFETELHKY